MLLNICWPASVRAGWRDSFQVFALTIGDPASVPLNVIRDNGRAIGTSTGKIKLILAKTLHELHARPRNIRSVEIGLRQHRGTKISPRQIGEGQPTITK